MSGIFSKILSRIYPKDDSYMVTILGLDYSGKTKTMDIPLPSRGNRPGGTFNMTAWDVGSGCASIRQSLFMLRHYLAFSKAIIWVVDSSDPDRLKESVELLADILPMLDESDPMKVPILILANKSDKPHTISVDTIQSAFREPMSGRLVAVFKTQVTQEALANPSLSGFSQAFDWLNTAMEIVKSSEKTGQAIGLSKSNPANPTPTLLNQREPSSLAQKLESWLVRSENDMSDEEYLEKFDSYNLPEWDHYTHIRIANIILTKYGRTKGKDMIFKGIEEYIVNSTQTKGRAFHVSMTYFWIQIVHLGIRNTPPLPENSTAESLQSFTRFLIVNPHVADGNLWSDYYSKEVLMSPKAKGEMVLPDMKPLPNLVTRDAITSFGKSKV